MMNGCKAKSSGVLKMGNEDPGVEEALLSKSERTGKFGSDQNEGGPTILNELDFEKAMSEAKKLVKVVLEQNNTSETRKLKRRLGKMEAIWKALMRWIYSVAESSSEGEEEIGVKDIISDPFIMVLLCGLPQQLPPPVVMQEIYRQVDCGQLTLHELNRMSKKCKCTVRCPDEQKENWVLKLPRFLGKRMINGDRIMILNHEIVVRKYTEVIQCYKCWRFGHYGVQCQRATRCKVCAGFHHYRVCTAEGWRCVNCTDKGFKEEDTLHGASSYRCPLFKRRLEAREREGEKVLCLL